MRLNSRSNTTSSCIAVALLLGSFAFAAPPPPPSISDVTARQHYPWDGKIDISFTASGIDASAELVVSATDSANGSAWIATSLSGDKTLGAGKHTVVWDLDAQGIQLFSSNVVFSVICRHYIPPPYVLVDISDGEAASSYPVSYLAEEPSSGWTEEDKTDRLVMRRIEAGSFTMGCGTDEVGYWGVEAPPHKVTIKKSFYIGVFEVTQAQYENVLGTNPSSSSNVGSTRPVDSVLWTAIRGASSGNNWPASSKVASSSFMGQLRSKTGFAFDLPTEAQWEYACRAGTTTALNNGRNLSNKLSDEAMDEVGRYSYNASLGEGGYSSAHTTVGSYEPNNWGLYDMHGNVWEWCLDWWQERSAFSTSAVSDPKGPSSGVKRVLRGGGWNGAAWACRSADRGSCAPAGSNDYFGFRVCCAIGDELEAALVPEVICSGDSAATVVDMRERPTVDALRVVYDVAWDDGGEGDEIIVFDNGDEAF